MSLVLAGHGRFGDTDRAVCILQRPETVRQFHELKGAPSAAQGSVVGSEGADDCRVACVFFLLVLQLVMTQCLL